MSIKIDQKIVGFSVVKPEDGTPALVVAPLTERPPILTGKTYRIKTPLSDHALYVTINDLDGKPFEIFINSKAMEHFQWIVALTRVVSAVFRHGGEIGFLVEELRSVFDPKGGYFKKGGKYAPSLVAEIGDVLEQHLTTLGLYARDDSLAQAAVVMLSEKAGKAGEGKPDKQQCMKCQEFALVLMDGCLTCVACGESKCG